MKKVLLIIGAIVVLILLAVGVFIGINASKQRTTLPPPGTTFPVSSSTQNSGTVMNGMKITAQDGSQITVKDFIHNGETVADVVNPGTYFLAGSLGYCLVDGTCPSGAKSTQFNISYNEKDGSFTVALLAEPLGASRKAAEAFLADRLGLTSVQLCVLRYSVLVSTSVNEAYGGISNLGFSSCQGATKLP